MLIQYTFVTGECIEIEVPDGIGEVSITIDKGIHNHNRKETRRHRSMGQLEDQGVQFPDETQNIASVVDMQETRNKLQAAIRKLLPHQRELIFYVFFEGRSITDMAREAGVTEGAIRHRLRKIYKKLKIACEEGDTKS